MPATLDTPPSFLDDLDTEDNTVLGNDPSFPDAVIMLSLGGNKFAAVNVTTIGPEPMTVGLLVCFATEQEAEIWEAQYMTGEHVNKEFQQARDIAVSKPNVYGLALQQGARTVSIHWVR
jgi:hypothetical protein